MAPRTSITALPTLLLIACAASPAVVGAAPVAPDRVAVAQERDELPAEESMDDDEWADQDEPADPFCPDPVVPDDDDGELAEDADDPDFRVDDSDEASSPGAKDDLDDVLEFCAAGPGADGLRSAPISLAATLRRGALDPGSLDVEVPGTIVRELRLAPGAPAALRRYRTATLGGARRTLDAGDLFELPVVLNATGRRALRAARREVRMTVATTLRLASGEHRTRTQVVVLRRSVR